MMELVQEGHLRGDNPSETTDEDPLARLAAEAGDDDTTAAAPEADSDAGAEPAPTAERTEPEPEASPKSQVREYVVLERLSFEDTEEPYTVELGRFPARNATNALRRAFKTLIKDDERHELLAVVASQWRVVPVQRSHRQVESVQIG